jgi:hypothetical protein
MPYGRQMSQNFVAISKFKNKDLYRRIILLKTFFIFFGKREKTKTYIAESIAYMQPLLVDVDENVLKVEAAFQQLEDGRVKADCNFWKWTFKKN